MTPLSEAYAVQLRNIYIKRRSAIFGTCWMFLLNYIKIASEGQTGPKRHFKHIGELVDGGAKVVIVYRTVPGEPDNCLVVGTKFLPDMYHNSLMKAVEVQTNFGSLHRGEVRNISKIFKIRPQSASLSCFLASVV